MKSRFAIAAAGFAFTSIFFINFCNLIYGCGCASLWAGADAHCNIHTGGRHCPFCSHGSIGYAAFFVAILTPQLLAAFRMNGPWTLRLAAVLALFPLAGGIVALATGWYDGYWR